MNEISDLPEEDIIRYHYKLKNKPRRIDSASFFRRQADWLNTSYEKLSELNESLRDREIEECTFHPKINKKSRSLAIGRLYPDNQSEVRLARKQLQEIQLEKELQECTFKPHINDSSRNAKSRLLDLPQRKPNPRVHAFDVNHLTFKPKINHKSMPKIKEYLAKPAFERLYSPKTQQKCDFIHEYKCEFFAKRNKYANKSEKHILLKQNLKNTEAFVNELSRKHRSKQSKASPSESIKKIAHQIVSLAYKID